MSDVTCVSAQGARDTHAVSALLDAAGLEQVATETYRWIKALRLVTYSGETMRERFRYRDDSLWWFTEIYLHKTRRLETAARMVLALERACAERAPAAIEIATTNSVEQAAGRAFGQSRGVPVTCRAPRTVRTAGWWPAYSIGLTTQASRWRRPRRPVQPTRARVAAFVHTAFWRRPAAAQDDGTPGAQESYIGPVLAAIGERLGPEHLACVGLGPRRNFRARRWWDPLVGREPGAKSAVPIEQLAPRAAVQPSIALWRQREALASQVVEGPAIREAGRFRDCDLWDVLRAELVNAACLQWPWSARAMDEAGAALDALSPRVAVTYAEAGGWGRALVLEARRRHVPSVGLQHGFIYRHWLNYLHEPDELQPAGGDHGFPHPDRTLLFDAQAARHLAAHGHLPPETLRVTGSPKRDALVASCAEHKARRRDAIRRELGVAAGESLIVLAAKHTEIRDELPDLFRAVATRPATRLIVKPHPAETPHPYETLASGQRAIAVAPADADLSRLLAAADLLVTRNSTVAIDALLVGLPALVIGLPNNLSPFVEAGVMAGAPRGASAQALEQLLATRDARDQLVTRARQFTSGGEMPADGRAAARAVDEILALA